MRVGRAVMIGVVSLAMAGGRAAAQEAERAQGFTPFMLGIVTPVQVPSAAWDVYGLRIDLIYGRCQTLYGLDVGLVNHVQGGMKGLQIGGVVSLVEGSATGLQTGLVNLGLGGFNGMQIGGVNYAERARAFQIGVYNGADHIHGVQLGVINVTRTMVGCQLGLVNVIQDNDVPFLPVFNCAF